MSAAPQSNPTPEASPLRLGQTFSASMAVLIAGLAALLFATGGGQSFTTEALRRQQVSQQPQQLDAFNVTTSRGEKTTLNALLANDKSAGKVWLVDFVYTRCQTLCSSLGSIYQQLQAQIEARGLQGRVGLLSISFDPANDDVAALKAYATRMNMNPAVWQIATLTSWQDRRRLLDAFGIMVVPAPLGEFEHNAALHVVSVDGKLLRILDYSDFSGALDAAIGLGAGVGVGMKMKVGEPVAAGALQALLLVR